MRNNLRTIFWGVLLLLGAPLTGMAEVTVKATLEESQLAAGVPTIMRIKVENGDATFPEQIEAEGLTISHYGNNHNMMFVNGTRVMETIAFYTVTGEKVGVYKIPSITFQIAGQDYTTEELTIEIIKMTNESQAMDSTRGQFFTFNAGKTEAYVYEMIPVECQLFVRGSNSISGTGYPKFENSGKFVVRPFPEEFARKVELVEGVPFATVRYPSAISALSPGDHELGPAVITAKVSSQPNKGIPSPLLAFPQAKTVTSNTLTFKIKPLPLEGRPEQFTGAVGRFTVKTQVSPLELKVGDPLSVDIQVSGVGNFDSVTAPSIPAGNGWKTYPANRLDDGGRASAEQTIRYSQVVIPTEELTELPPIELAYFDPSSEEYVIVASDPIPLKIEPDPLAMNKLGAAALASVGFRGEQLDDILFINTGATQWQPLHGSILDRPAFWIMNFLPAVGLMVIFIIGFRQWSLEAARRKAARKYPTPGELRHRLGHERVNRGTFYTVLLACFDRMNTEHKDLMNRLTKDARGALDRLSRQGNSILYSGAQIGGEAVSREEKHDAMLALQELEAISESS